MRTTNFIIFGSGRAGSTVLTDLLNQHPQISCEREILKIRYPRHKHRSNLLRQYAPRLLIALYRRRALQRSRKPIYGFKLRTEQVQKPEALLQYLHRRHWKIIWLYRRDLFRQIISEYVARATRRYHGSSREAQSHAPRLTMPTERFERQVHQALAQHRLHLTVQQLTHLTLVYEDDLKTPTDQQRTVRRIADLLGVEAVDTVSSCVQPSWKTPYSEIVVNYDELQALYRTLINSYSDEQLALLRHN